MKNLYITLSSRPIVTKSKLLNLRSKMLKAAQKVYNDWDEEDEDTYAGGGICHLIADEISDILNSNNIEATPVSSNFEQHVFVVARVKDVVYEIDIPHYIYETGGGFNWKKIKGVKFSLNDLVINLLSADPDDFKNYVEDY